MVELCCYDGNSVITLTLRDWDSTAASVDGKSLKVKVTDAASKNAYGEAVYIREIQLPTRLLL